jgi:hypothetical protein
LWVTRPGPAVHLAHTPRSYTSRLLHGSASLCRILAVRPRALSPDRGRCRSLLLREPIRPRDGQDGSCEVVECVLCKLCREGYCALARRVADWLPRACVPTVRHVSRVAWTAGTQARRHTGTQARRHADTQTRSHAGSHGRTIIGCTQRNGRANHEFVTPHLRPMSSAAGPTASCSGDGGERPLAGGHVAKQERWTLPLSRCTSEGTS